MWFGTNLGLWFSKSRRRHSHPILPIVARLDQFPWYLPGFSGTLFIAVGIPMITTSFRVLVLDALYYPHKDMTWFVLALAGGLVIVFLPPPRRTPRSRSNSRGQTPPAPAGMRNRIAIGLRRTLYLCPAAFLEKLHLTPSAQ
jgi:hypothetical protein